MKTPSNDAPEPASPLLAYAIPVAVKVTNLSRTLIYEEIRKGNLRAKKCGARTVILHDDLMAFLKGLRNAG
jgi:hypothetical protein